MAGQRQNGHVSGEQAKSVAQQGMKTNNNNTSIELSSGH